MAWFCAHLRESRGLVGLLSREMVQSVSSHQITFCRCGVLGCSEMLFRWLSRVVSGQGYVANKLAMPSRRWQWADCYG